MHHETEDFDSKLQLAKKKKKNKKEFRSNFKSAKFIQVKRILEII